MKSRMAADDVAQLHLGYQNVGRLPEGGGLPDGTVVDALVFSKSLICSKP
ncbi:MAG: hypothetical protein PHT60_12845 [Acidiphilium sp.]|nr:hypothetical protein [Acidiphilium sp.]MDD4936648.1 hypothetical protein [Acidiphilium sp.]